jgi:hypothetical protein
MNYKLPFFKKQNSGQLLDANWSFDMYITRSDIFRKLLAIVLKTKKNFFSRQKGKQ